MIFNNEPTIFDIPSLSSEWIFHAQLFFNRNDHSVHICNEINERKGKYYCVFTIFHTMIGDINQFSITCRDFTTDSFFFKNIFEPILNKYCNENLIELKFDQLL